MSMLAKPLPSLATKKQIERKKNTNSEREFIKFERPVYVSTKTISEIIAQTKNSPEPNEKLIALFK